MTTKGKNSTALAKAPSETLTLTEFNPRDPQTLLATAAQLAQFVTANNLASTIQNRSYVQCEGWQFLFAVAGLDVICAKPTRLASRATDNEIIYEAEARLFDPAGREVGYGYAICSDSERTKRGWAEYAIASMAQTRAIGKAGRNRFAFVMKAAGFEPTPKEEMDEVGTSASVVAEPKKPVAEASAPASAPQEASIGADQSIAGPSVIPAEILAKLTRQFEAVTSGVDLKKLWDSLTKNEATALFEVKEAAKARLAEAVKDAATTAVRQAPAAMKVAGEETSLVDEFVESPLFGPGPAVEYATGEQRQTITRLLDHPAITRKEKTRLLLAINKLDRERARQAIGKLRTAIGEREGIDPRDGSRAQLKKLVAQEGHKFTSHYTDLLLALAANPEATLEALTDALTDANNSLIDDETYGTDAELAAAEADEIKAAA
jgi:hypothetical protein